MKTIVGIVLACSATTSFAGDITVFQQSLKPCTAVDQQSGRCKQEDPLNYVACVTYQNNSADMLKCDLRGTAQFVERYTGNTKDVLDWRTERLFPQQQHRVCFNFRKDQYFLWQLRAIGVPSFSCVVDGIGEKPTCNPQTQLGCQRPSIDAQTPCDPFDWGCH